MGPEEVFREAQAQAAAAAIPPIADDAAVQRLRLDCATLFDRVPEPPVHRWRDDPARARARTLLAEARELLVKALTLERNPGPGVTLTPLLGALKANVEALHHMAEGHLAQAEEAWRTALELEAAAKASRRAWTSSAETEPPVYERTTGVSRFDPRPAPLLSGRLACPYPGCQQPDTFSFAPAYATHRFTCASCHRPFTGYIAEGRAIERQSLGGDRFRYLFRVQELQGGRTRVEFEDASGAELIVAPRDLLAFLYTAQRELKAVLNLSSGRVLWVTSAGPCFLVSAAFGAQAVELAAFRDFRDRVLIPVAATRMVVHVYYRAGPAAARWLGARPRVRAGARWLLRKLHRQLIRGGFS